MNYHKIYSATRTAILVGSLSVAGGGGTAFVIAGACRIALKLEENTALIMIGLPIFALITTWSIVYLPSRLRKAGLIE